MVACRQDSTPILLLSGLAEHTQNIKENQQASLLIDRTAGLDNPLTGSRVTLPCNVTKSEAESDRQRFINRHSSATDYTNFSDFSFYTFAIKRVHIVAGFGHIH